MLIGCDLDGTLYRWTRAVNDALMAEFGIDDPGEHDAWNHLRDSLPDEQWQWIWSSRGAKPVFGREDLVWPGAVSVINALANTCKVHFVTHRSPYRLSGITGEWLAFHFRNYRGVHVVDNSVKKHTLADWDVFIDDKSETVEGFCAALPRCLTLKPSRPWNSDCTSGVCFSDWAEVLDLVAAHEFAQRHG